LSKIFHVYVKISSPPLITTQPLMGEGKGGGGPKKEILNG